MDMGTFVSGAVAGFTIAVLALKLDLVRLQWRFNQLQDSYSKLEARRAKMEAELDKQVTGEA